MYNSIASITIILHNTDIMQYSSIISLKTTIMIDSNYSS